MSHHIEIIRGILATMQRISQDTAAALAELSDMIEKELTELESETKGNTNFTKPEPIIHYPIDPAVLADYTGTDASYEYKLKRMTESEADFSKAIDRLNRKG